MGPGRIVGFSINGTTGRGAVMQWGQNGATLLTASGSMVRGPYSAMTRVEPSFTEVAVAREIVARAKPGMYVTGLVNGEEFGGIVVEVHETGLEFAATEVPDNSMLRKVGTLRYREVGSITRYGPPSVKAGDQITVKGETYTVQGTNQHGVIVKDEAGQSDAFTWEDLDEAVVSALQ